VRPFQAVLVGLAAATASCSSSTPSIVGKWELVDTHVSTVFDLLFNADGTCGEVVSLGAEDEGVCRSTCTYTVKGDTFTMTDEQVDGGSSLITIGFSISGNTLTLDYPDAGGVYQGTRVNSDPTNTCP
jgi:hypothetical protein